MQYCAKAFTGSLKPGDILTEAQESKLGKEKLADLVARGALVLIGDSPAAEKPEKAPDAPPEKQESAAETEADEEIEEELPELSGGEDLVSEAEPESAKPAKKQSARRKKA